MKRTLVLLVVLLVILVAAPVAAEGAILEYLSPRPGALLVSPGTSIALRLGEPIKTSSARAALFTVVGSTSGLHSGFVSIADDGETVIWKPDAPFAVGEEVSVTIARGLTTLSGRVLADVGYSFSISPRVGVTAYSEELTEEFGAAPIVQAELASTQYKPWNAAALPSDIPDYETLTPANGTAPGYVFTDISDFFGGKYFLTILDAAGEPVYYQRMASFAIDFKRQPNGQLSYCMAGKYYCLDNTYTQVDEWQAGNGYGWADNHDLQILPNGHALLMIYDRQPVDMSQIAEGGRADATVEGLIVQELDVAKNVVFEWRSWDHIPITDTYVSLTTANVDYIHGNAVEVDTDGNLLISSRNICEITKIDRSTGEIIWRLGGKNNEFTFTNETEPYFAYQHDIRRLANGNVSLFDNRAGEVPPYSRAVEYALDQEAKTATRVWEYYNSSNTVSNFMGNAQRLVNGNTMIGWGSAGLLTEVKPDGEKALEIDLLGWAMSYRSFRFEWEGHPASLPTLALLKGEGAITLAVSWNGATEIASYRVYGGDAPEPTTLLATQAKTGFETRIELTGSDAAYRYYRMMPVDKQGQDTRYSNDATTFEYVFLPLAPVALTIP